VAAAAAFVLQRDMAVQRFVAESASEEQRTAFLPVYWKMIRDFFPFGSGFGSFDPVFRSYEPDAALAPAYMNHAHNDWAQIAIEGGAPALALALIFLGWFAHRTWRLWRLPATVPNQLTGRAGSLIVLLLLLASLVDYPLRTPLLSCLMAIACVWISATPAPIDRRHAAAPKG